MFKFSFKDIEFKEEKEGVKIIFLEYFHSFLKKEDLLKIGSFKIGRNYIEFDSSEKKSSKFNFLLEKAFKELRNFKNKPTTYIHQNSGIPLIGTGYFGIVDRGTNLIEIKPVTGCNLSCIYCSVDEDKRIREFVIEKDYLISELKKVVKIKENPIEVHIASQGEPLLYKPLIELIKDIKSIETVKKISLETNGVLLTKELIDKLTKAGLSQFNLSINSLDKNTAVKMAGCKYPLDIVKNMAEYASKKLELVIAPVLIESINEKDMDDLVQFCKKINAKPGIQNYLNYRHGRNVKKQMLWEKFYEILENLEKKHNIILKFSSSDFKIKEDISLEKPFKKDELIEIEILTEGRFKNEMLAVAKDRVISVVNCNKTGKSKVKIIRSKHNIFVAKIS